MGNKKVKKRLEERLAENVDALLRENASDSYHGTRAVLSAFDQRRQRIERFLNKATSLWELLEELKYEKEMKSYNEHHNLGTWDDRN